LRRIGADKAVWDKQYGCRKWLNGQRSPVVLGLVSQFCQGGTLVEFGCGDGLLPRLLPHGSFSSYIGIDISDVAIRHAKERHPARIDCHFIQGRMENWEGDQNVSLILMEECLYYLSRPEQDRLLQKCLSSLGSRGRILVVVHERQKHLSTLQACQETRSLLSEENHGERVYLILGNKAGCDGGHLRRDNQNDRTNTANGRGEKSASCAVQSCDQ